jgi:all-trans-retinol dehydrogenase (NAD+)
MKILRKKKVLITGGASGLGKIMGRLVLERGSELIIWDINSAGIEETKKEFSSLGKVHGYTVDVSQPEEIKRTASIVKKEIGLVDVLINNAGIVVGKYFSDHTPKEILNTMNINANAPMLTTSEFLPGMVQQNSGYICNIASSAGLISNPKMSVYVGSKWAVTGWSDSLRIEMKKSGKKIWVTTVTPYYINTGMFEGVKSLIPMLKPEKVARKIIRGIERNRIYVSMPWNVNIVRFFQGIFPIRFFDWFVGGVLGIYKGMDQFKGHSK